MLYEVITSTELKHEKNKVTRTDGIIPKFEQIMEIYNALKTAGDKNRLLKDRITSYNVCYTKLLRLLLA